MQRLGLLRVVVLGAVSLAAACDGASPPDFGTIVGSVQTEGQGIDGITVSLTRGTTTVRTTVTAGGGTFRFDDVEAGEYTVTLSGWPVHMSFELTSASATIVDDGEVITLNFRGSYIRTSRIAGTVTVAGEGLGSVTVRLSGTSESETVTDAGGHYDFPGLRAGSYTIEISGFDTQRVAFDEPSATATVAVGETGIVNFEGRYLRNSAVTGTVTIEEEPLEGVTVSLEGVGEMRSATTHDAGEFAFTELFAGRYKVTISDFDTDEHVFISVSVMVDVALDETTSIDFAGTYLRTSAITGQVTVDNHPLAGVTVTVEGKGEAYSATTNSAGQFTFSELRAGDYTVAITNPDEDEFGFEVTSRTVSVGHDEMAQVPFEGILLRTAAILGTVTVEGTGLEDVTVTITGGPNGEEFYAMTNGVGQFSFTNLHAGDYSVGISGFDDDIFGFEVTTSTVTVELQETATVPFEGILLRTAAIQGTITVEGQALAGVTVTVTGGPKDEEHIRVTNEAGFYMVDLLHAGDYAVTISGYDANTYEFETSTRTVSVGLRETATVAFEGKLVAGGMEENSMGPHRPWDR